MPELRKDPVIGRWVIISTERGKRPTDFTEISNNKKGGFVLRYNITLLDEVYNLNSDKNMNHKS